MNRWSDHFVQIGATARVLNSKTSKADVMVWEGYFEGHLLCIVSTVRLNAQQSSSLPRSLGSTNREPRLEPSRRLLHRPPCVVSEDIDRGTTSSYRGASQNR